MRTVLCPRCETHEYLPYDEQHQPGAPSHPAVSRLDNETLICSPCGTAEALRDFMRLPLTGPTAWPVPAPPAPSEQPAEAIAATWEQEARHG